jgi:hypothetical protein
MELSVSGNVATALLRKVSSLSLSRPFPQGHRSAALIDKMELIGDIPMGKGPAAERTIEMKSGEECTAATVYPKAIFRKTPLLKGNFCQIPTTLLTPG